MQISLKCTRKFIILLTFNNLLFFACAKEVLYNNRMVDQSNQKKHTLPSRSLHVVQRVRSISKIGALPSMATTLWAIATRCQKLFPKVFSWRALRGAARNDAHPCASPLRVFFADRTTTEGGQKSKSKYFCTIDILPLLKRGDSYGVQCGARSLRWVPAADPLLQDSLHRRAGHVLPL